MRDPILVFIVPEDVLAPYIYIYIYIYIYNGVRLSQDTVTGEFPAQKNNKAENISIWWRHYVNDRFK